MSADRRRGAGDGAKPDMAHAGVDHLWTAGRTFVINTALPPEVFEVVDEDGPGELEAGKPPTCHSLYGPRPAG